MADFREYSAAFQDHQNDLAHYGIPKSRWSPEARSRYDSRHRKGHNGMPSDVEEQVDKKRKLRSEARSKLNVSFNRYASSLPYGGTNRVKRAVNNGFRYANSQRKLNNEQRDLDNLRAKKANASTVEKIGDTFSKYKDNGKNNKINNAVRNGKAKFGNRMWDHAYALRNGTDYTKKKKKK